MHGLRLRGMKREKRTEVEIIKYKMQEHVVRSFVLVACKRFGDYK